VQAGPFSFGTKIITGDPGPHGKRPTYEENGQEYYAAYGKYDPIKYSNGIRYFGVGPFRLGYDSEDIRHYWQNEKARAPNGIPFFPRKKRDGRFYFFW
jgi:hypothetical protein